MQKTHTPPRHLVLPKDSAERRRQQREQLEIHERGTWKLWALSISITLVLALALAIIFFPAIKWKVHQIETRFEILPQLILGLLTLVFLESAYVIIKQRELNELRDFIIASYAEAFLPPENLPRDCLTGILDRRALPDIVTRECAWVERYRIPLCLVLFDIRNFGKINQNEGNLAGDLILKDLASTVQSLMRQSDSILRHGADEFLCFLPRTDRTGGEGFIRRVTKACQASNRLRGLTLDYGLAVYEEGMSSDLVVADTERDLAGRKQTTPQPVAIPQASVKPA